MEHTTDLIAIQDRWQEKWEKEKAFQPKVEKGKKKFFLNAPYPYINAYPHIGHLYTYVRTDAFARYKRLSGHNVLFPQGWHATGSPIISAAKRVKEKEPKQIKIMKDMGFSDEDIETFSEPKRWIEFFAPEFKKDFSAMGFSIDWRREFFTTSLNPHYDRFVSWQFRKLKEKKFVIKGKFPVVWDPKENVAVGDHDRIEGEGETPQEFCLVKHKLHTPKGDELLVTATLRQDTILGITSLYIHPNETYAKIKVKNEVWIVGRPIIPKLREQDFEVEEIGEITGRELIGKKVEVFGNRKVLILPATFLDASFGTGIVHSVPSDSADDLISLHDLQKDDAVIKKYGLDADEVRAIQPIAVLNTPEYGDIPAQKFLEKYQVKSQHEKEKLSKIKAELYKVSYYTATFNHLYKNVFSENLEGVAVEKGKDIIKRDLLREGVIELYYQLTGKVVARSLSECVVKIVSDQWFMDYANPEWKKSVKKSLEGLRLYPEKSRQQFENVVDWLHEWACTREEGMGTRLPWDEKWLIESLSDSTIYMAYYTIAHRIKEIPIEKIDDNLFDYVLLGKKEAKEKVHADKQVGKIADELREEFDYWYPFDFRNSGKDLIQNHLTFCLFNHTAIFSEQKWPKGFGVNGWVTVDGQKMSKSLGNMIPMRKMAKEFSADVTRATILSGGEELDDPNWETDFARSMRLKLEQWLEFVEENYKKKHAHTAHKKSPIDTWFLSRIDESVRDVGSAMEETHFRTAFQAAYFELSKNMKWYLKRCGDAIDQELMNKAIEAQIIMMAPITPHICEEAWEKIGKKGFVSLADWPKHDESKIEEDTEWIVRDVVGDIRTVMKLANVEKPSQIRLFAAETWKYELFKTVKQEMAKSQKPQEVMGKIMNSPTLKKHGQDITKILPRIIRIGAVPRFFEQEKEKHVLLGAVQYIESEFGAKVEVIDASASQEAKAKQALPGKPAIMIA